MNDLSRRLIPARPTGGRLRRRLIARPPKLLYSVGGIAHRSPDVFYQDVGGFFPSHYCSFTFRAGSLPKKLLTLTNKIYKKFLCFSVFVVKN